VKEEKEKEKGGAGLLLSVDPCAKVLSILDGNAQQWYCGNEFTSDMPTQADYFNSRIRRKKIATAHVC
jgi:hypothetical protein